MHANSPAELPARLEALGALGGLGRAALHSQLAAAVRVVLHLRRVAGGQRLLSEVSLLRRIGGRVVPVSGWRAHRGAGPGWQELCELLAARGGGVLGGAAPLPPAAVAWRRGCAPVTAAPPRGGGR